MADAKNEMRRLREVVSKKAITRDEVDAELVRLHQGVNAIEAQMSITKEEWQRAAEALQAQISEVHEYCDTIGNRCEAELVSSKPSWRRRMRHRSMQHLKGFSPADNVTLT